VIALPRPAELPLDDAGWEQTRLMMLQLIVQLLAVIQQQTARIAALEARLSQTSRNSDRPPSSDPPYANRPARSGAQGPNPATTSRLFITFGDSSSRKQNCHERGESDELENPCESMKK
jgi:Family of unknown function (DUF6444)